MLPMSTLLANLDAVDRQYWLSNCEGFRVRCGTRHLGIVEFVRHGSDPFLPDTIHICAGITLMREIAVPVGDVEGLDPRRRMIWVRPHEPAGASARHRIAAWMARVGTLARTPQRTTPRGAR
jgi:hypothetical protein